MKSIRRQATRKITYKFLLYDKIYKCNVTICQMFNLTDCTNNTCSAILSYFYQILNYKYDCCFEEYILYLL